VDCGSNNQSELTNLKRGMHFNRSGMGSTEYAKLVGVSAAQVTYDGGPPRSTKRF
jgi:hypothetical protein